MYRLKVSKIKIKFMLRHNNLTNLTNYSISVHYRLGIISVPIYCNL